MKKILIIVDMQKDFTNGVLGNAECEAAVQKIAIIVKQESYDFICLTRDTHYDNYLETQEGKKLPIAHCIKDTDGWQIREEIMNAVSQKYRDSEYKIVDKESFGSISLGQFLCQEYQSEELEIHFAGVCTGICVISNVLIAKAALPEAKVCVIEDACACVTPESHKTAIEAMKTCQVDII